MKNLLIITIALFASFFTAPAQSTPMVSVLESHKCFVPPQDDMVVMDAYTFSAYQYASEKCDTLKAEIKRYDSIVQSQDSVCVILETNYENLLKVKDAQIKDFSNSYESVRKTAINEIENNNRLQVQYKKLEDKNRRTKHWRNIFFGTSGILAGVLVLIVAH